MCHFFNPDLTILPLVILDETVENNVAVPAGLVEVLAYLFLNGRRDEARAIAILIIIGVAMLADEALTHVWLHPFGHVVISSLKMCIIPLAYFTFSALRKREQLAVPTS